MKTKLFAIIIAAVIGYFGFVYIMDDSTTKTQTQIPMLNQNTSKTPQKSFSTLVFERHGIDPHNIKDEDIGKILMWETKD